MSVAYLVKSTSELSTSSESLHLERLGVVPMARTDRIASDFALAMACACRATAFVGFARI